MKGYRQIFVIVAPFILWGAAGCGGFEETLTAADCLEGEVYDPVDEWCYPAEALVEADPPAADGGLTAADCFADEYFDEVDQQCYLDLGAFDEEGDGLISEWLEETAGDILDHGAALSSGEEGDIQIRYEISGETLGQIVDQSDTAVDGDRASHEQLWTEFASLIPGAYRRDITRFGVFSDGRDGTLAFVEPNPEAPTTWIIALDPADTADRDDFTYTLIHEYGHVLTLNDRQVPFDQKAYFDDSGDAAVEAEMACSTFFTGEGCADSSSYIHAFFDEFWTDIYDELPFPDEEGLVDEDELFDFYQRYSDRFVTEYAATNPGEDIAESWTHFVLKDKPLGNTAAERKILFFYRYSELIALRQEILARLVAHSRR